MLLLLVAARKQACCRRYLTGEALELVRRVVTPQERAALRAARKQRATAVLQQSGGNASNKLSSSSSSSSSSTGFLVANSKWTWYASVLIPSGLLAWAIHDENSPPARFSRAIGLTKLITGVTDDFSKPSHEKLLPDWDQMPNVPHDIPIPHTLVLGLEHTLVSATWDRKYGWRYAKRPGVDKFLHTLAQYYEIVVYTTSMLDLADPVVNSLDKSGCIMHRLYRDAVRYQDGARVKDLSCLNRNVGRMVAVDDDGDALRFHPDNLVRVKPYEDPTDRTDDTLERILPFLVEIARQGCNDVPGLLHQYRGMDADEIADAYEHRIEQFKMDRQKRAQRGLGGLATNHLPPPELAPQSSRLFTTQPTAKDLVGAAPPPEGSGGVVQWLNRRSKEKEEQNMRKLEKWNEVMIKKQQEKRQAANK